MYSSKMIMEAFPNIHLLGVFTIAFTVVYRQKALYPIYIFVLLIGLFNGFSTWWIPYLYIWTILWGITMLLPIRLPAKAQPFVYMTICALHGLLYGTLYAPIHAIFYGLSPRATLAWIAAGFPWDCIHSVSNLICGLLIVPIIKILQRLENHSNQY